MTPPPPAYPPYSCSHIRADSRDHKPRITTLIRPTTSRSIQHRSLLARPLVIYHPKEVPQCRFVACVRVQWYLLWFNRSETLSTTPPKGQTRQWNFDQNHDFSWLCDTSLFGLRHTCSFQSWTIKKKDKKSMHNFAKMMVLLKHKYYVLHDIFHSFFFICSLNFVNLKTLICNGSLFLGVFVFAFT